MSRGFRVFLVASGLFLWFLVEWQRGPAMATAGVGVVAGAVAAVVLVTAAAIYAGTIVHELGHAIPAAVLTPGRPLIEIGKAPRATRFSIGRIDVHLGAMPGQAHCVLPRRPLTRGQRLAIYAGGPLASVSAAGSLVVLATHLGGSLATLALVLGLLEAGSAVHCLVPREFERPGDDGRPRTLRTDGAHIAAALRNRPVPTSTIARPAPLPYAASPRARQVIGTMLQLARGEGCTAVHTRHLLEALSTADEPTRELLGAHGWTSQPGEPGDGTAAPPPTPALRRVLAAVGASLLASGRQTAEPEHFLIALLRSGDTEALAVLRGAGVDLEGLRWGAIEALGGPTSARD